MDIKTYHIPERKAETQRTKPIWVICGKEIEDQTLLDFLKKIMDAVKVDLEGSANLLLHTSESPQSTLWAFQQKTASIVLLFGVLPSDVGLHISMQPYQIQEFKNTKVLWAENLLSISENIDKKKSLWAALQELFRD